MVWECSSIKEFLSIAGMLHHRAKHHISEAQRLQILETTAETRNETKTLRTAHRPTKCSDVQHKQQQLRKSSRLNSGNEHERRLCLQWYAEQVEAALWLRAAHTLMHSSSLRKRKLTSAAN